MLWLLRNPPNFSFFSTNKYDWKRSHPLFSTHDNRPFTKHVVHCSFQWWSRYTIPSSCYYLKIREYISIISKYFPFISNKYKINIKYSKYYWPYLTLYYMISPVMSTKIFRYLIQLISSVLLTEKGKDYFHWRKNKWQQRPVW